MMDDILMVAIPAILFILLMPVFVRARGNARRAVCQSNLEQISVALRQYRADNDGVLPSVDWVAALKPYVKEGGVFRCPTSNKPNQSCYPNDESQDKSDYFFNARVLGERTSGISAPQMLIWSGDGGNELPLEERPSAWLEDRYSPAWRHVKNGNYLFVGAYGANYLFADGHVKWLKVSRVNRDFRVAMK